MLLLFGLPSCCDLLSCGHLRNTALNVLDIMSTLLFHHILLKMLVQVLNKNLAISFKLLL